MGARTLYPPDVATVYVPIFAYDGFRPGVGEQLTEAVAKEIELKTNYRVVGTPEADSILTGRIVTDRKRLLVEDPFDNPRELETNFVVEVAWVNRHRNPLTPPTTIDLPPDLVGIGQTASLIAEAGQSSATSRQLLCQRLAEQIVATMEQPW